MQVFVGGNLKLDDASNTILAAYKESAKVEVAAPKQEEEGVFAYTNFGAPGKIATRGEVKDLEITQVVFANGVRVNFKKTDFEKNSVRVVANFGGGKPGSTRGQARHHSLTRRASSSSEAWRSTAWMTCAASLPARR